MPHLFFGETKEADDGIWKRSKFVLHLKTSKFILWLFDQINNITEHIRQEKLAKMLVQYEQCPISQSSSFST